MSDDEATTATASHYSHADPLFGLPEADRAGVPLCERALVGALMIDGGLRRYAVNLAPAEFADRALGRVFQMLMSIDGPVDLVIAVEEAERNGLTSITGVNGMAVYLAALLDLVPDVDNVPEYVKRVKRASVARRVEEFRSRGAR